MFPYCLAKHATILFLMAASAQAEGPPILAYSFVEPRALANEASIVSALEARAQGFGFTIADCRAILGIQAGVIHDFEDAMVAHPQDRDQTLGLIIEQLLKTGCLSDLPSPEQPIYVARILIDIDQGRDDRRSATVFLYQLVAGKRASGRYEELYDTRFAVHESWQEIVGKAAQRALDGTNNAPVIRLTVKTGAQVGRRLKLSAANSYDPDGDPLEFKWECSVSVREQTAHKLNLVSQAPNPSATETSLSEAFAPYAESGPVGQYSIPTFGSVTGKEFECPVPVARPIQVVLTVKDNHGAEHSLTQKFYPQLRGRWRIGINSSFAGEALNPTTLPVTNDDDWQIEGGLSTAGYRFENGMGLEIAAIAGYGIGGRYSKLSSDVALPMGRHEIFVGLEGNLRFAPWVAGYSRVLEELAFVPSQAFLATEAPLGEGDVFKANFLLTSVLLAGLEFNMGVPKSRFVGPVMEEAENNDEENVVSLIIDGLYVRVGIGISNTTRNEPYARGLTLVGDYGVGVRF